QPRRSETIPLLRLAGSSLAGENSIERDVPLFDKIPDPLPAPCPQRTTLEGATVSLEPLDAAKHTDALWPAVSGATHESLWRYMPDGPFLEREAFDDNMRSKEASEDPLFYAIVDRRTGLAVGRAALMRIDPRNRVIEVGNI